MVNVGGPSRGCITCIRRKIRCDRQRPICGQCQKSRRRCEGYRNETDMLFRDQSQAVVARASAGTSGSIREAEATTTSPQTLNVAEERLRSAVDASLMTLSPRLNAEAGLIAFFANNFTCTGSNRGNNLFWVPSNFDDLLKNDVARCSVQSVGAMALARLQRSSYYDQEAQKNYGLALQKLASLWRQHAEIDKDAILITILFLSFFEILASHDSSSRQSWTTHLGGLGLLLKRRKDQFLATDFGARMLLQSRSQVILNALQTKTPVPEAFRVPDRNIQNTTSPNVVQSDNANMLLIRLATLQAQYRLSGASGAIFAELTALDVDLRQWVESVPPSWSFSTQPSQLHTNFWWDVRCDVYSTAVMAHVWNNIRAARIIVYDLIQEISLSFLSHRENDVNLAIRLMSHEAPAVELRRLVTDICATVPIYYRPSGATAGHSMAESRPLLGTTYWLLWVLEIVGSMREASLDLGIWIQQCLERIYDTTGIVKARLTADRVKVRHGGVNVAGSERI